MRSSIFSGSWDETIRVWDTDTHEEISNLKMHTENVNGLTFHENKLYSGNPYDLQIWDINRRQLKKKANMDWSQGGLSKVFMKNFLIYKNKLFIGFTGGMICILDINTYKHIISLGGYSDYMEYNSCCLTCYENKLYSGGGSYGAIHIWNPDTYEEIASLEGHTNSVRCLTCHDNKLYSGSHDNTIRVWNTETHEHISTLEGHTRHVSCLTYHDNKLYSGSHDKTIRIWNTETYEEIATLEGHTYPVRCITVHENKLYSGSNDGTIRVWNI